MIRNTLIVGLALMTSLPVLALKDDTSQPIHINSDNQSVDLQKNIIVFFGNVFVKQGSIEINAEKVVVNRSADGTETIEATGKLVKFTQLQDDGNRINGHSSQLNYNIKTEKLQLLGNAYLEQQSVNKEQQSSSTKAPQIDYSVKEQRLEATNNNGKGRIETILNPVGLQQQKSK